MVARHDIMRWLEHNINTNMAGPIHIIFFKIFLGVSARQLQFNGLIKISGKSGLDIIQL